MIKFSHIREEELFLEHGIAKTRVDGKGGATIAYEALGNNEFIVAVSKCHHNDNFCKRTGRIKAAGRLKSANQSIQINAENRQDLIDQAIKHFGL